MSARNDGGPAFPTVPENLSSRGATLRDYFAAKAMQAAISGHFAHYGHDNYWAPEAVASYAMEVADAMLAAREAA